MQGGHDDEVGEATAPDAASGGETTMSPASGPPAGSSGLIPPGPTDPVLPWSEARTPQPMVDPVTQPRPGAATWYRTDEERARSVYRRANPWYRRIARGIIGLGFLAVAVFGVYAGARAIESYLERDQLPAAGVDVPEIRATSFIVTSGPPAPTVDGTVTLDVETGAFEFVGRATGVQSGLQVVSPDGSTVYVRQGAGPWRTAAATDGDVGGVLTAISYLTDDDTADDILTNRLRRGFVELVDEVDEGSGDAKLTRYDMTFDTELFARDFPLQWQEYQSDAVPGATVGREVPVTIWLDDDGVLMRVEDGQANWAWERLTYSDQPFRPIDPADDTGTRVVQVACVSDDNSIFWQTPFGSCDEALVVARDTATTAGVAEAFDDLDRQIAQACSTLERDDGPVPATTDEVRLAEALVEAGVCRGDPAIFTPG